MIKRFIPLLPVLLHLIFASGSYAQTKKILTAAEYSKWQSLGAIELSPNGQWAAWQLMVQEDNDTLFVKNRVTDSTYKIAFASVPEFSKDNQWIAYRIGLPFKEAEKLRDQSKPIEYKMGLLNLASGKKEMIQNINRFEFSKNGKFLAAYLNAPKDNKDKGAVLLVKNLSDGSTRIIGNVTEYAFNKKADYLAYIVESANIAGNSAELFNLQNYTLKVLASDTSKFVKLTWQKEGEALAFFKTYKKDKYDEENAVVYIYNNLYKTPTLQKFDLQANKSFADSMRISPASSIIISNDMRTVFFGLNKWTYNAPAKKEDKQTADSLNAKEKATADTTKNSTVKKDEAGNKLAAVDIWHWKDPEIQPRQKITLGQDSIFSYLSAWHLDDNSFVQLTNEETPLAQLTGNQQYAILFTDKKYKPAFKEDYADAVVVNVKSGAKKMAFEKTLTGFNTFPRTSPDGKWLAYFKDKHWWSYNIASGQNINLTKNIKTDFWNIRDDHPASRPAVGSAGWTKGDKEILLYDEYNVWAVKPDGNGARKLTDGEKEEIVFRVIRLDAEEIYIDDSKPIYMTAYGDKSKMFGYYKYEKGKLQSLIFENKQVGRLVKAKDAVSFGFVKQDYDQSPELYLTNNFATSNSIQATNLQQKDFYWGKSELINFTNKKGKKMQGALFYPANYEAGKKYPMIVYIYETLSNTVHNYINPSQRSAYNTSNFTTNGYFIFRPDIVYDINDPGMSAVNCVLPAVEELLKTGMIDKDKMGIMGHSWGAYQTSFIITQTPIFKAAVAGAPLTNLISMSNSIYWNSGTPDSKIFETSQGRFDGPWYERMDDHMRNSPMYNAANIQTPLLVAFGDKDGAVDWHQGIEMYTTMRRMQKPHILLVYADENHGLAKKENQIDYQKRQKEFFDHYLLGMPAEKWITEGIPMQEKIKQRAKESGSKVL